MNCERSDMKILLALLKLMVRKLMFDFRLCGLYFFEGEHTGKDCLYTSRQTPLAGSDSLRPPGDQQTLSANRPSPSLAIT